MSEFNSFDEAVRPIEILHRCEEGIEPSYRASYLLRNSPVALPAYARLCYRQGNVNCYAKSSRAMERNVSMSTGRRTVALRNACISRFLQIENLPHVLAFPPELYKRSGQADFPETVLQRNERLLLLLLCRSVLPGSIRLCPDQTASG